MEQKERKYYNRSTCTGAQAGTIKNGEHKVLKLRFTTWDRDTKEQVTKFKTLFLTEDGNERNRETLMVLGVQSPPAVCSLENVKKEGALDGLGNNVVDLVAETNDAGYENVKYVNQPRFGLRVYDLTEKTDF